MEKINITRPPLSSLACPNQNCALYGQTGQENLRVRKLTGKNKEIRYLRCRTCQEEFSERKNTPLWRSKIEEKEAVSIAEHLAEGTGIKATARLSRHAESTVRRLQKRLGEHGRHFHDQQVKEVNVTTLQADERHGYATSKSTPAWEAEVLDPVSKFVLAHTEGKRDETLIAAVLTDAASRLLDRHQVALFTDGLSSYDSLFTQIFGRPYQPARSTHLGRPPKTRYRIPRTAAHVQIIKHHNGRKLERVEIRYAHGSQTRIEQALKVMGCNVPNTSAIERRNGTARLMSAAQHRKTLNFAKRSDSKLDMGWWAVTVYNWCRAHHSLRQRLAEPVGKKQYNQQSPAMAIGLTNHIYSCAEVMLTPVYPR
jgi:IS1 family transposase/transposase-like protein